MKYVSTKFNSFVSNTNIVTNDIEKLALRFILWSFATLALIYVLLLGNMVFNIIERRSLEISARALSSEVRDLELTYLSVSSGVDITLAHSLGFKETNTTFATRKSLGFIPAGESF